MKKILFVNKSFNVGGIQSSLNNLLNIMSKEESVDIDVLVFFDKGRYRETLPDNVHLIEASFFVKTLGMSLSDVIKTKNPILIAYKVAAVAWAKVFGNSVPTAFALLFQKKLKGYDYAFAYHHETKNTATVSGFSKFIIKKCEAKCKAAWIHTDIVSTKLDTKQNKKTYSKLDKIIAVSDGVRKSFIKAFPEMASKTEIVHNFHQFDKIIKMSEEDTVIYKKDAKNFLTVARLSWIKGHKRTLECFEKLKNEGYEFYWHVVGGSDKETEDGFKTLIKDKGLTDRVVMYGEQNNPYRFFPNADALILSSYAEAAPMVFSEARCLKLPVITTKTSSAEEFVSDKNVGIVCENNDEALLNTIRYVLDNSDVLDEYKNVMNSVPMIDESKKEFLELLNEEHNNE